MDNLDILINYGMWLIFVDLLYIFSDESAIDV